MIDALPPGPVNPGKASLEVCRQSGAYLYFVADGSGGHVFSESYAEHQKNAHLRALEKNTATDPAPAKTSGDKK